jgi:hypothetical protein
MRVAVDVLGPVDVPYQFSREEDALSLSLRNGFIERGLRRSSVSMVLREAGHLQLCTRHSEKWFGSANLHLLTISISRDTAPLIGIHRGGLTPARLRRVTELGAQCHRGGHLIKAQVAVEPGLPRRLLPPLRRQPSAPAFCVHDDTT